MTSAVGLELRGTADVPGDVLERVAAIDAARAAKDFADRRRHPGRAAGRGLDRRDHRGRDVGQTLIGSVARDRDWPALEPSARFGTPGAAAPSAAASSSTDPPALRDSASDGRGAAARRSDRSSPRRPAPSPDRADRGPTPAPARHAVRLPARPRRAAGAVGDRGDPVPRRVLVDAGRVDRRRGVLRRLRVPDHVAAARGARPHRCRRPGRVLVAAGPPAAPRSVRHARRRRACGRCVAGSDGQLAQLRRDYPWALFYAGNWGQIVGDVPYYAGDPPLLRHLWSLAIEEQFYLVWPLVFVAITWSRLRRLGAAAARRRGGAGRRSGRCSGSTPPARDRSADLDRVNFLYLSTFTRAGGLLAGAAAAFVWRPWRSPPPSRRTPPAARPGRRRRPRPARAASRRSPSLTAATSTSGCSRWSRCSRSSP